MPNLPIQQQQVLLGLLKWELPKQPGLNHPCQIHGSVHPDYLCTERQVPLLPDMVRMKCPVYLCKHCTSHDDHSHNGLLIWRCAQCHSLKWTPTQDMLTYFFVVFKRGITLTIRYLGSLTLEGYKTAYLSALLAALKTQAVNYDEALKFVEENIEKG